MVQWFESTEAPFDLFAKSLEQERQPKPPARRPSPPSPPSLAPRRELPPPLYRHGDRVRFLHANVEGSGKLVASSINTVTVRTDDGREHVMSHGALRPDCDAD